MTTSSLTHILSGAAFDLDRHAHMFGPVPAGDDSVIAAVSRSGLAGRGGAGFSAGAKMAAITGRRPVMIANGSEGEPLSSKDAVLLSDSPHLVLDGLSIAAAAVRATDAFLVVPASHAERLRNAIAERRHSRWDRPDGQVGAAAGRFVSGEKTALIAAGEGKPPIPRSSLTSSSKSGVKGRPTLVHNVETLAHVATIARFGVDWFRASGTASEPGTMLVTLSGAVHNPGVVEVPIGSRLEWVVGDIGRADIDHTRAVLVGGYHGTWINRADLAGRRLSKESLAAIGASPGAGVVHALAVDTCGLRATADIVDYLARESAGQCGPCLNGLPRLASVFGDLAYHRPGEQTLNEIRRYAGLVDGRGACHHPDGTVRLVRSALTAFADDVRLHSTGHCEARALWGNR